MDNTEFEVVWNGQAWREGWRPCTISHADHARNERSIFDLYDVEEIAARLLAGAPGENVSSVDRHGARSGDRHAPRREYMRELMRKRRALAKTASDDGVSR